MELGKSFLSNVMTLNAADGLLVGFIKTFPSCNHPPPDELGARRLQTWRVGSLPLTR